MGTRNLTIIKLDDKYPVAQYGQWDGYPSGQGATVLEFLQKLNVSSQDISALEFFKKAVRSLTDYSVQELEAFGERTFELLPQLSRDMGAGILQWIMENEGGKIGPRSHELDFAGDSLFCEYAYLLDLDEECLEVYKGFNESPLTEKDRFCFIPPAKEGGEYKQIKLVKSYPFSKLPSVDEMMTDVDPPEDDEETSSVSPRETKAL